MRARIYRFLLAGTRSSALGFVRQVRAINRKYAAPHIETTRMVKACLLMLRCYLLLLVAILVYKFLSLVR